MSWSFGAAAGHAISRQRGTDRRGGRPGRRAPGHSPAAGEQRPKLPGRLPRQPRIEVCDLEVEVHHRALRPSTGGHLGPGNRSPAGTRHRWIPPQRRGSSCPAPHDRWSTRATRSRTSPTRPAQAPRWRFPTTCLSFEIAPVHLPGQCHCRSGRHPRTHCGRSSSGIAPGLIGRLHDRRGAERLDLAAEVCVEFVGCRQGEMDGLLVDQASRQATSNSLSRPRMDKSWTLRGGVAVF